MKIHVKILNEALSNHIQQHIEKVIYIMIKWDLFLECKDVSTYGKNHCNSPHNQNEEQKPHVQHLTRFSTFS